MTVRKNQLGELVKDLRGSKSQEQFQQEVETHLARGEKLPGKYISVVETGARRELAPEFVNAFAKLSGRTPDDIKKMYRRQAEISKSTPTANEQIRLVLGHSVWGCAVVGAALRGLLPNVKVVTCAEVKELENVRTLEDLKNLPASAFVEEKIERGLRLPSPKEAVEVVPKSNDHPPLEDHELFARIERASRTSPLSASDALAWLQKGEADVAAVPRSLLKDDEALVRVGQLVDSAAGCTLICTADLGQILMENHEGGWDKNVLLPWNSGATPDRRIDITTQDLAFAIKKLEGIRKVGVGIGAEQGTLAQTCLHEVCAEILHEPTAKRQVQVHSRLFHIATFDGIRKFTRGTGSELSVAAESSIGASSIAKTQRRVPAKSVAKEMVGLITWEPHATWLLEASRRAEEQPLAAVLLRRSPDPDKHRPRHLEFDLVVQRARSSDESLMRRISEILDSVWKVSNELSSLESGELHALVEPLARYYGVADDHDPMNTSHNLMEIIGPVRFDVAPVMESKHLLFRE